MTPIGQCRCVGGGVGCWRAVGGGAGGRGCARAVRLGVLTWVYPPDLVDRVVAACGRAEQRRRLLPARLVVYFVLALALFSPAPYLEVLRHLTEGLRDLGRWGRGGCRRSRRCFAPGSGWAPSRCG